ncbi:MAG: amino acid permease [Bacteroidetes bacterium]|nr:amino acid permease [Bacteroidota bacterium]
MTNIHQHSSKEDTSIGLAGAIALGIGAMVGGGILALAGVAFSVTGASAILAFLLNGFIAFIIAMSFAEMASRNPQNGGIYTYAKRALSIQLAFGAGWVVWLASIMASVFYALGFGVFASFTLQQVPVSAISDFFSQRWTGLLIAIVSVAVYTVKLSLHARVDARNINVLKVLVFAILIAGGLAVIPGRPLSELTEHFSPAFSSGFSGLAAAMGYTFVAIQGFVLVAYAAGDIRDPQKNIPKALFYTLGIGLIIYIPLLVVVLAVGIPDGVTLHEISEAYPETLIAVAAEHYLGKFGLWLVLIAGLLSMLTALQANLFAASRVANSMAADRTMLPQVSRLHSRYGTPVRAIHLTALLTILFILVLPNVASAAAASSLIFLLSFALAQFILILIRKRAPDQNPDSYKVPFFPTLPIIGIFLTVSLALFQSVVVPSAGVITLLWLFAGSLLFIGFFLKNALVADVSEEARNPEIIRLRGNSPLLLLPITNPANVASKLFLAQALSPPTVGRTLLLNIVKPSAKSTITNERIAGSRDVVYQGLLSAVDASVKADTLITIAKDPWKEIERVARSHRCQTLLLGPGDFSDEKTTQKLEDLITRVPCDVVVLRQPYSGWKISEAKRVLIPVGGFDKHDLLRARITASLWRNFRPEITFLQILPENATAADIRKQRRLIQHFGEEIVPAGFKSTIILSNDVKESLVYETANHDLMIMGLGRLAPGDKAFGTIPMEVILNTDTAVIFISHN